VNAARRLQSQSPDPGHERGKDTVIELAEGIAYFSVMRRAFMTVVLVA
jgi:hypothetical protein